MDSSKLRVDTRVVWEQLDGHPPLPNPECSGAGCLIKATGSCPSE
jgi:hypothetical protein